MTLRWFTADLHVHTCLSPCADLTMTPRKIVARVLRQGLDIIAVTDHNSAENAQAVAEAAEVTGLAVLPGLEVCTREEVHVLAIFDRIDSAGELQQSIFERLSGINDPDLFGMQIVATPQDDVERIQERLLIGAADLSLGDTIAAIHRLGGLAIASHIDREAFGIIGHLGFIPRGAGFDALEISAQTSDAEAAARFSACGQWPWIRNSDAHSLDRIGTTRTRFLMAGACCEEIRKALHHAQGRRVASGQDR